MDVIHLGRGIHTLTPEVGLSGNPSTSGIVSRLCVVAEVYSSARRPGDSRPTASNPGEPDPGVGVRA